jgi:hypothetical protein
MKRVLYIICFICCVGQINAQQASDYFPAQESFKWNFMVTPLDSLNNELDTVSFFRQDSFAVTTNYEGKLANLVLSKEGFTQNIHLLPYTDSLYYHFMGTTAYEYFEVGLLGEFLKFVDSLITFDNFTFVDFFTSLEAWYTVYRFGESVNNEYTIFSVDTTVSNDTLALSLRVEYLGERLEDETINTQKGPFACKKFLIQQGISILFGPFPIPVAFEEDTVWIAESNWIVQDIIPSTEVDLMFIGIEPVFLPGLKTEIIDKIVSVDNISLQPVEFALFQNYPNPFNPVTSIQYAVGSRQFISIKVYDVLGNEIATLVNEEKPAGIYKVEFDATQLTSGIYFYRLQSGSLIETKKMILLK